MTERTEDNAQELRIRQAAAWLEPGGPVARRMPGFEVRPQQLQMAEAVARVLAEGRVDVGDPVELTATEEVP